MQTVFEKIPEYFVVRYDADMIAWATKFREIGPVKTVVLKEGYFSDPSPDPELGPQLLAVRLLARMERNRTRVTITPLTDMDEAMIRKHCEKLMRLGIGPQSVLPEPERSFTPRGVMQ